MPPAAATPSAQWLTDPTVFAVNRHPQRSYHRTDAPRQSLNGPWEVLDTDARAIDVADPESHASVLRSASDRIATIPVPSALETNGGWGPAYVNIQMPWDGHADPEAPSVPDTNRVALYRRLFTLDEDLRGGPRSTAEPSCSHSGVSPPRSTSGATACSSATAKTGTPPASSTSPA